MTETFSFQPPSISSPHYSPMPSVYTRARPSTSSSSSGYDSPPSVFQHQPPLLPHAQAVDDEPQRVPTSHGDEVPRSVDSEGPYLARVHSPPAQPTYHPSFPPPHPNNSGVNMRNTRPMTAPSSVSAPYFHGAHYSPSAHPISSSFYAPQAGPPRGAFQYEVDLHHAAHNEEAAYRGRQFSLPDVEGRGGLERGLPDEPRYGDGSTGASPPFLYGPPRVSENPAGAPAFYQTHQSDSGSSPEQSDQYSRPTTGDSRSTSSSHTTVGPPSTFHQSHRRPGPYSPGSGGRGGASPPPHGRDDEGSKTYNFIAQPAQSTKRPRRRYDEIERLYTCDYPGCTKAYGTLNHLNSHKTMQKHGPKSTPARACPSPLLPSCPSVSGANMRWGSCFFKRSANLSPPFACLAPEFKELRKAWRDGKKAAAAAAARSGESEAVVSSIPTSRSGAERGSRPRPSTSAGEYHYSVPAQFMSSVGTPMASYNLPTPTLPQTHYPITALNPPPSGWAPYIPAPYDPYHSSSPHRPVTAPSYYSHNVPVFGFTADHPQHPLHSNGFHLPERRGNLPSSEGRPMSSAGMFAFSPDPSFPSILEEAAYPSGYVVGLEEGASGEDNDQRRSIPGSREGEH